jgi:hypothetical protein
MATADPTLSGDQPAVHVMSAPTRTYKEAYGVLSAAVQSVRGQKGTPDVDSLLTTVRSGLDAYEVCRQHLDAVEVALAKEEARVAPPAGASEGVPDAAQGG